jgi:hypothetical protein
MESQTETIKQLFSQIEDKRGVISKQFHKQSLEVGYDVNQPKHNYNQRVREFLALLLNSPTLNPPPTEEELDGKFFCGAGPTVKMTS